ncbi:hypothetical protein ACO0LG_28275 [Undibacterium sp. Ji42W]|uniref:hypothetical protein n=1 Tax=Undibacterium sp. Ji42W TaxID=3413039 RepID=UPI003BF093BA
MIKYLSLGFIATLFCFATWFAVDFYRSDSKPAASHFPYSVSTDEKADLERKAVLGDCDASTRLAQYYLYGALDLDAATKYLRVAAKCSDIAPKEYLVNILMRNLDNPAATAEIKLLIDDIRKIDPEKATKLEDQLNATKKSKP